MTDVLTLDGGIPYAALFSEVERNVGPQLRGDWMDALKLLSSPHWGVVLQVFQSKTGTFPDQNSVVQKAQ